MTAPFAKEQMKLLSPTNLSYGAAPVQGSRGFGLSRLVADAIGWVVTWPRRQAVMDELSRLSDRELSDIGLNRSEIHTVFARAR